MSQLKKNIIANFGGQAWTTLLSLILVPVYLRYMGVEVYGLIGFFASLQAIISLIDMGLSTTANREISRYSTLSGKDSEIHELVNTLEYIYWGMSLIIVIVFLLASGYLASSWLTAQTLSKATLQSAIIISGTTFAFRWPLALYHGILRGKERQVLLNGLIVTVSTARAIGTIFVVVYISHLITTFLLWQLAVGLIEIFITRKIISKILPCSDVTSKGFNFKILDRIWRFSLNIGLISILAAVLKQLDKILLSKLLPLEQLAYYTAASAVVMAVSRIITAPVLQALFPRLTAIYASGNEESLSLIFHKSARMLSFIITPIFAVFIFFSTDILFFWTRSQSVAINGGIVLSILGVASMFNSMRQIPFYILLAAGLTKIPLVQNILGVLILTPLMVFLVSSYGLSGCALSWAIYNICSYLILPQFIHAYVLKKDKFTWFFFDTLPFMAVSTAIFGAIAWLFRKPDQIIYSFLLIISGLTIYLIIFTVASRTVREMIKDWMETIKLWLNTAPFSSGCNTQQTRGGK